MNLTCHEFIVCSEDKNAPLLLSEFTGSASLLNDGAIIINPWDTKNFSQAILKGLETPFDKRKATVEEIDERHYQQRLYKLDQDFFTRYSYFVAIQSRRFQDLQIEYKNTDGRLPVI